MTQRERQFQRSLRLAELRAKYPDFDDTPLLAPWLESLEAARAMFAAQRVVLAGDPFSIKQPSAGQRKPARPRVEEIRVDI